MTQDDGNGRRLRLIHLFDAWIRVCRAKMAQASQGGPTDSVEGWRYRGNRRPPFALKPGPGQESVWDFPRPPAVRPDGRLVEVSVEGVLIAHTRQALRVLETGSPPTFYIPPADVRVELLEPSFTRTICEWKGEARYYAVRAGEALINDAAWSYPRPKDPFLAIAGRFAFYPGRVECRVDGERARPQVGDFYGGWVTRDVAGPFKGGPGTAGW